MDHFSIIIGGDLVPTTSNEEYFITGAIESLADNPLLEALNVADFRIYNLEVPLADKEQPIPKCGPNLIAKTSTINGIKSLNPNLLTLANNHICDQDKQGLFSTIDVLKKADIACVGVGANLQEACKPYLIEQAGMCIGVYACAEHEFSIATSTSAGANPFDPLESLDHIHDLKSHCDYVIVLYHGGKEHYRYPSPYLQKACRKMAQKGADLVVCQHSHCIGCYEEYEGSVIVYGQGNFLFDHSENEFWQTSLLLRVCISDVMKVEYIPIVKAGNAVRLANEKQSKEILQGLMQRSIEIQQEGFIEKRYTEFAEQMHRGYLVGLHGNNLIFKVLNKICRYKLTGKLYSEKLLLKIRNIIECEAHRELILKGLTENGDNKRE